MVLTISVVLTTSDIPYGQWSFDVTQYFVMGNPSGACCQQLLKSNIAGLSCWLSVLSVRVFSSFLFVMLYVCLLSWRGQMKDLKFAWSHKSAAAATLLYSIEQQQLLCATTHHMQHPYVHVHVFVHPFIFYFLKVLIFPDRAMRHT